MFQCSGGEKIIQLRFAIPLPINVGLLSGKHTTMTPVHSVSISKL
jgi:hypothetical protein